MKKRKHGNNLEVSALGLGCMSMSFSMPLSPKKKTALHLHAFSDSQVFFNLRSKMGSLKPKTATTSFPEGLSQVSSPLALLAALNLYGTLKMSIFYQHQSKIGGELCSISNQILITWKEENSYSPQGCLLQ